MFFPIFFNEVKKKRSIAEELYEVDDDEYSNYSESEEYRNFCLEMKKFNIKYIAVPHVHLSQLDIILDTFQKTYSIFPGLYRMEIENFHEEETSRENKSISARFRMAYTNKKDKPIFITRDISISVEKYRELLSDMVKYCRYNKVCGEDYQSEQISSSSIAHEIGHALINVIASCNINEKTEHLSNKEVLNYLNKLNDEDDGICNKIFYLTCAKLKISANLQNIGNILTVYAGTDTSECFAEAFSDFNVNPYPSEFSMKMIESFVELYPEFVNINAYQNRVKEVEKNFEHFPPEKMTSRIIKLNHLRAINTYPYETRIGNMYNACCPLGTLDGEYGKSINDFVNFKKAYDYFTYGAGFSSIQSAPQAVMTHPLFQYSSPEAKKAFIFGIESAYATMFDYIQEDSEHNFVTTFKCAEDIFSEKKSKAVEAGIRLVEELSDPGLVSRLFPLTPENDKINWRAAYDSLDRRINITSNDYKILAEVLPEIIDFHNLSNEDIENISKFAEIITEHYPQSGLENFTIKTENLEIDRH